MASFSAELRVAGRVYPLLRCDYGAFQSTAHRGRVHTRVRYRPVELLLDAPRDSFLAAWGADAFKQCAVDIVFRNANGGQAIETLRLAGAYCVGYGQVFRQGDARTGSYVAHLQLSDPLGFTWQAGGPGAYAAPAAGEHGRPVAASATPPVSSILSDCTESVRQNLQNQVKQNCKNGKQSCLITDNCPVLEETMETLNACIAARTKINMKCFKGGDDGNKEQIQHKINGLVKCQGYYFSKCNKTPQPVPAPRRAPSSAPINLPPVPKEVPLTIAGVGLFILYLLSGALRPGPI